MAPTSLVWRAKHLCELRIVRVKNEEIARWEERWTGDYVFGNDTMTIVDVSVGGAKS